MSKKRTSSFRGKTTKNADSRKRGSGYGYLLIPNGVDVFSPEMDSKVDMDIMPYTVTDKNHPDKDVENEIAVPGSLWYKRPFKTHRSVGANNDTFLCPTTFGKKCPICEYRDKLRKDGGDEDEIKQTRASDRNLYAIIIKNNKKVDDTKVHFLDISDYLFQEKFEEQLSDDEKFEVFPDHQEGFSVRVRFAEDSFGANKFANPSRFDFVDRKEQYDDDILEQIPNLDECFKVLGYDELKAKFFETEPDDDEEDEKPKTKVRGKVKPSRDEEEDEDEPEEDEDIPENDDDEEEEEEKPQPRKRKIAGKETKKPAPTPRKPKVLTCPSDYVFGKDTDKYDECEDCEIWNECIAAKKAAKKTR
jgi:hypothetical protein